VLWKSAARFLQQVQNNPRRAMKTVRLSLLLLGGLGLALGLAIFMAAPLLVHLVLGAAYQGSVPVLRVFSIWIPAVALSTVIIFQLLLPNHLDNRFNFVNSTAVLISIVVSLLLAPRFKAVGIAWSAVAAELYAVIAFSVVAGRAGLNPFARASHVSAHTPPGVILVPVSAPGGGTKARSRENEDM
jgi:O-antigen/teichoic acid export membrane protein